MVIISRHVARAVVVVVVMDHVAVRVTVRDMTMAMTVGRNVVIDGNFVSKAEDKMLFINCIMNGM